MQLLILVSVAIAISFYALGRRGISAIEEVESKGDPEAMFDMSHLGYDARDHMPYEDPPYDHWR